MRRISAFTGLAVIGCLMAQAAAADGIFSVPAESVRVIQIKGIAKDIVIANPAVADITSLRPDYFTIIGKAPGRTSLLILDADQKVLLSTMVVVTEGDPGILSIQSPRGTEDYACTGRCTLIPGSSYSRGAGAFSVLPPDPAAKKEEPPAPTQSESQFKMRITPNGTITGTQVTTTPAGQ